jgi:hypothetical protein
MNCHRDRFLYEDIPWFLLSVILVPITRIRLSYTQVFDEDHLVAIVPQKSRVAPSRENYNC